MKNKSKSYKVLTIFSCYFFLFILLIYLLSNAINKLIDKERKVFDYYMYDLIKNNKIKKQKEYYNIFFYYETRIMFNKTKWHYRIIISVTMLTLIIFNNNLKDFFMCFFNILPVLKWPTVKEVNSSLIDNYINLPNSFVVSLSPIIIYKNIDFTNIVLYCSTIYYLVLFICIFSIIKNCIGLLIRFKRANQVAKKLFYKKEKKIENQKSFSTIINSPIPNVEKYLSK